MKREDAIPQELKQLPQWCTWKLVGGKKLPYRPGGGAAKADDPSTFSNFANVKGMARIGFFFTTDDPFCGIDLDGCLEKNEAGKLVPKSWAKPILAKFDCKAYCEISPSGTGLKLWIRGKKPDGAKSQLAKIGDHEGVECYDHGRYFCVTGQAFGDGWREIGNAQEELDWLLHHCEQINDRLQGNNRSGELPLWAEHSNPLNKLEQQKQQAIIDSGKHFENDEVVQRAIVYLSRMEESVSHFNGHSCLLRAATAMRTDFGLSEEQTTFLLVSRFNRRCVPMWTLDEITHKVAEASKNLLEKEPGRLRTKGGKEKASTLDAYTEAKRIFETCFVGGFASLYFWAGSFWNWKSGCYSELPIDDIRADIYRHLNASYHQLTQSHAGNVQAQLAALCNLSSTSTPPLWLTEHEWEATDCISTPTRVVHLPSLIAGKDLHSIPATPKFFSTMCLNYDIGDYSDCVGWKDFLTSLWPDDSESISLLQEWCGYLVSGSTAQHKMMLMVGPPRSGKGTIGRVLTALLGETNCCAPTLKTLTAQFGLSGFVGKTFGLIGDARLDAKASQSVVVERLLSISGEDRITVDRKYREPVDVRLPTRLMILSNLLPRFHESSSALANRMLIIETKETFLGREDTKLESKLLEELNGILWWSLEGLKRLNARGRFAPPVRSQELIQDMVELNSPIAAFVNECCSLASEGEVLKDDLFETYQGWCIRTGHRASGREVFFRDLSAAFPRVVSSRPRTEDGRVWTCKGISLKPDLVRMVRDNDLDFLQ